MTLAPRLEARPTQALTQKLAMTPQMQQAIRLLALTNLELEGWLEEAAAANPLLEVGEGETIAAPDGDTPDADPAAEHDAAPGPEGESALDIDAYARDPDAGPGDTGDWGQAAGGAGTDGAAPDPGERGGDATLAEHLLAQLGPVAHDPREALIAEAIILELEDTGYLRTALADLAADLGAPIAEVERALALIQTLDPTGVGARDLGECLALQAREADRYDPCMARLIDNLDVLAGGDIARLRRLCDVDEEDFADMLAELRGYDPKPGCRFGSGEAVPVVPDILVESDGAGGWRVRLNEANVPRLVVNRDYHAHLSAGARGKDAHGWIARHLAEADWLVRALDQRQRTILRTATEIVRRQAGFLREGIAAMRPLTLREVAEAVELHESTISRVTSNKYLACPRGTFALRHFFSSGVGGDGDGGEAASSAAIKARIRALCAAEDAARVLSDEKLADLLRAEGFDLARRTVAKYREAIGIGSSAQRRREKRLQAL